MLPFIRLNIRPEEEQDSGTIQAWVVDVPDQKHIASLLAWLKRSDLGSPSLAHLRRIRRRDSRSTLLISPVTELIHPTLPTQIPLPTPYILPVPASSALTPTALTLKSALWPTLYTPRRRDDVEPWTTGKLTWAWDAMRTVVEAARRKDVDELPIAAHLPAPYNSEEEISFTARDTRKSTKHPLRHAALNIIRALADHRSASSESLSSEVMPSANSPLRNGSNYLLTDLTIFITHEPCIMCSMALLHSRVKEVIYLYPSPQTGGCGGSVNVPGLNGVNHRFGVLRWNDVHSFDWKNLVDWTVDV